MTIAQFDALAMDVPVSTTEAELSVAGNANDADSLKNEFLTLMVAQIQNQDPLNPMDGAEYVSQLAQFSQVESTENMATLMQNNLVLMDNMQVLTTAGLVGQTVYVSADTVELVENEQNGKLVLSSASDSVNLLIQDAYGEVTKVSLGPQAAGEVSFTLDPEALDLAAGSYTITAQLEDGVTADILLAGEISQVTVPSNGGSALVNVAGVGSVPFYEISQFGG
ncbi:flagellar basal body rod modification protein [Vibrio sp. HA2012]|uniref:flagellar hook assembly protein FlgD n=1 Tax=Vibrio sp. HA2012 TaxID=1971595 RepID=UPI000C2C742C|nr:flagellar hook assembly protein FlgD [Vibrio sp. HA2012]PJC86413.1 flagellar basal body rod modification protein [Vibrio sp. HA2012]